MARTLRPGAVMAAYLAIFLAVGPWPGRHAVPASAHALARDASLSGIAIGAFLSWRVTRGSAGARGLIMAWSVFGFTATFISATLQSGSLVPAWLLVGYAGQMALLVSQPVYDRTRKDPAARSPGSVSLWPAPPRWMLAAAAAVAVPCTLLGLGSMDFEPVPGCQGPGYLAPHSQPLASSTALSQGYPVHFLSAMPDVSLDNGSKLSASNLDLFAEAAVDKGALAEDLALWALAAFASMYLLWIPNRRPDPARTITALAAPDSLAGR